MIQWNLNTHLSQWEATVGDWRAIVVQLHANDWYPYVERIGVASTRYDGPSCELAVEGRVWCATKIAEVQATQQAQP